MIRYLLNKPFIAWQNLKFSVNIQKERIEEFLATKELYRNDIKKEIKINRILLNNDEFEIIPKNTFNFTVHSINYDNDKEYEKNEKKYFIVNNETKIFIENYFVNDFVIYNPFNDSKNKRIIKYCNTIMSDSPFKNLIEESLNFDKIDKMFITSILVGKKK